MVTVGDLAIDLARKRVARAGADVRLTPTEWAFLELLARNLGRLVAPDLATSWSREPEHEVTVVAPLPQGR